jgi:hypothetical protein
MAEEVTLEFLAKQLNKVLDRMGAMEDQITVLTGITMRLEGQMAGMSARFEGLGRGARHVPTA